MKILMTGSHRSTGGEVAQILEDRFDHTVKLVGDSADCDYYSDLGYLTTQHQVHTLWDNVTDTYDPDVLINLAGITRMDSYDNTKEHDWKEVLNLNLMVPWLLTREFLARSNLPKTVINIASMGYKLPLSHSAAYCASKAGLVQMTKVVAKETADEHKLIVVAPGSIGESDMIDQVLENMTRIRDMPWDDARTYVENGTPMKRMMTMREVAQMIEMAIIAPMYMTGAVLEAGGGA